MSRLADRFAERKAAGSRVLACFITAGDGGVDTTLATMHAMVEAGADVVELGVPFSDPMADGPAIQLGSERALAAGTRVDDVFETVRRFRAADNTTPVVLMGYMNPMEARGVDRFAADAALAGTDGVIVVDMPPQEGAAVHAALREQGLDLIVMVAPTTAPERVPALCASASGFIYFVSIKGVTGTREAIADEIAAHVGTVREHTDVPVGIGFGIRDEATARAMAAVGDAVIVGTVLVEKFAEHADQPERIPGAVADVVRELRRGVDAAA